MKAKKMRTQYFESYVEFEHIIKMIARKWKITTKDTSLFKLIKSISSHRNFPFMEIKISIIINQNNRRNWLAHMHKNSNAPKNLINDFDNINILNDDLLSKHNNQK